MKVIGCIILLLVGLSAADKPVYAPQGQFDQHFEHHHNQQQAAPELTYGPPELPGRNWPQGPSVIPSGVQYPTWQWPQKHFFKKPVPSYQPVVQYKPFHIPIPKPQFVPVYKPFPIYKPQFVNAQGTPIRKPTFGEIKEGFASKIASKVTAFTDKVDGIKAGIWNKITGFKTGISDKVTGIKTGISDKVTGIKTGIYDKVTGIKTGISDKVTGFKTGIYDKVTGIKTGISDKVKGATQKVFGIKAAVADGITDKVVGLKVIGAHIGDEIKQIGTAVGSAVKYIKDDFYHKKQTKPHYVLVPSRPQPQRPTYTYIQPQTPSLTYGPPEHVQHPSFTYGAPEHVQHPSFTYGAPGLH